jgi:hypothetical protein
MVALQTNIRRGASHDNTDSYDTNDPNQATKKLGKERSSEHFVPYCQR